MLQKATMTMGRLNMKSTMKMIKSSVMRSTTTNLGILKSNSIENN